MHIAFFFYFFFSLLKMRGRDRNHSKVCGFLQWKFILYTLWHNIYYNVSVTKKSIEWNVVWKNVYGFVYIKLYLVKTLKVHTTYFSEWTHGDRFSLQIRLCFVGSSKVPSELILVKKCKMEWAIRWRQLGIAFLTMMVKKSQELWEVTAVHNNWISSIFQI